MPNNSNLGPLFTLDDWRESLETRRQITRAAIRRVVVDGECVDAVIDECKRAVSWYRLSNKDRNAIAQNFRDVRTITANWNKLTPTERARFEHDVLVPSTLATRLRTLK